MSPSQTSYYKNEIAVIGDSWESSWLAYRLLETGHSVRYYRLKSTSKNFKLPLYLGNGEVFAKACRVFGTELALKIWELSAANYLNARKQLPALVPASELSVRFIASSKNEQKYLQQSSNLEPASLYRVEDFEAQGNLLSAYDSICIDFSLEALETALFKHHSDPVVVDEVRIENRGAFEYGIHWKSNSNSGQLVSSMVFVFADRHIHNIVPTFGEKLVPVAIPSYVLGTNDNTGDGSFTFLNSAIDYVHETQKKKRFGSFRSLYSDAAVGTDEKTSPQSEQKLREYFQSIGWLKKNAALRTEINIETLSCDGLPIVGTTNDWAGVFVLGGFSGRSQNFLFAISEALVSMVMGEKASPLLDPFSTKRFV